MTKEATRFEWGEFDSIGGTQKLPEAMHDLSIAKTEDQASKAYWNIDGVVVENGLLFSSAMPVVICLLSYLQSCSTVARPFILELLVQISSATSDNEKLNAKCLKHIYSGLSQYFFIFEHGDIQERALCLDLIGISCEYDEDLKYRVRWWISKLLAENGVEEGVRKLAKNWLKELA